MCRGAAFLFLGVLLTASAIADYIRSPEDYDEWAIEITQQKKMADVAKDIANKYNLEMVRVVSENHMPKFFHFRAKMNTVDVLSVTKALRKEPSVIYAMFQVPHEVETKVMVKELINIVTKNAYDPSSKCHCHDNSAKDDKWIPKNVFDIMNGKHDNLSMTTLFNDFRWPCQWQLYNCGQTGGPNEYGLDIPEVWKRGITGNGMVVAIVDDGLEYTHVEIAPNYDKKASFDFVEYPDFDGPFPYSEKSHGTSCAGVVGMAANNGYCGVGVVYEANIGALRFIGRKSTDVREAASLIFNANYIDVYSNSWGPTDDGKLFRKPPRLTALSLERGCENGRSGRGNIYAFASGNGGAKNDHCGADGFSCSIYTIAIAASTPNGRYTDYSEQCTCIMVTVPSTDPNVVSSGDVQEMIVPTLNNGCSNNFRGTSSVTPLASSVFTMLLQANPNLTWRDVQYLIANTALVVDPYNENWQINGAGYHVHPYYGFGALNALHIVTAGEYWKNVDKQRKCQMRYPKSYKVIPSGGTLVLRAEADGCQNKGNQVLKLEHVQVVVSYSVKCRGDISVKLTSPCGTVSPLMNTRSLDDMTTVIDWPYMSVFHWGEDPRGTWTLEIKDNKGTVPSCMWSVDEESAGHLWQYDLVLWGVNEQKRSEMVSPVCDKKHVHDYLNQGIKKDKHFMKLILKGGAIFNERIKIYDEFVEDFSATERSAEAQALQQRPSGPKKTQPYSAPYQKVAMSVWMNSFRGTNRKSLALANYITKSVIPLTRSFTARHFDAVRRTIARRLLERTETRNDDGETVVRADLLHIASALLQSGEKDESSIAIARKDAAIILRNVADKWDF